MILAKQRCLLVALMGTLSALAQPGLDAENWVFLENDHLRLGVIRDSGAAIGHLGPAGSGKNLLNHFDQGRFIQQSYYGDADGSNWVDRPWRYNPVQGGDYRGKRARLLELRSTRTTLYSKSIPLHWASGDELAECVMEQWIELRGPLVQVRFQLTYRGEKRHQPRHQELPAVFVDASLDTLVHYAGDSPWTGGELIRRQPGQTNEYFKTPERWSAWVNRDDAGIGVYVPVADEVTCYRFAGGAGSECSYVAPIATFALEPGLIFSYDAYFAIGPLDDLRATFEKVRAERSAGSIR
jgi:hypothetical protein